MKLSDLRPCDACRSKVAPSFYFLRFCTALLTREAQTVLGTMQIVGSLAIAEAMAPSDDAVVIAGEKDPSLWTDLMICRGCFLNGPIDLALLWEKRIAAARQAADAKGPLQEEARGHPHGRGDNEAGGAVT